MRNLTTVRSRRLLLPNDQGRLKRQDKQERHDSNNAKKAKKAKKHKKSLRLSRTMKPELPPEIAERFPEELVRLIMSFVPHHKKVPSSPTWSPSLQRELNTLSTPGKVSPMYLMDLDDFVLDTPLQVARPKKRR
jgi:hypothetical protein